MGHDQVLTDVAADIGVTVGEHIGGPKGLWWPHERLITLRRGLGPRAWRCTLAHEIGHAVAGDQPVHGVWPTRAERRADEYAARLLISPTDYARAEAMHGPHPGAIADELDVTVHLLMVWRTIWERERENGCTTADSWG